MIERYKASLFPPKLSAKDLITDIVNGFCQETSFSNIQEHGCAVCGAFTSVQNQISLDCHRYNTGPFFFLPIL